MSKASGAWWLGVVLALGACTTDPPVPMEDSASLCERVAPAASDGRVPVIGLSEAHAAARLFGSEATFQTADLALAAALTDSLDHPDLDAYAQGLDSVCALPADDGGETAARVTLLGEQAWVRPGAGEVALPAGASSVVLDLRGLAGSVSEEQIAAAVAPALATPVTRARRETRVWSGYADQVFVTSPELGPYSVHLKALDAGVLPATGSEALPVFIVNDATMTPAATAVAEDLLVAGRARLIGHDLLASVGELRWFGVGDHGLAVRVADHPTWPDRVAPFVRTDDAEAFFAGVDLADFAPIRPASGPHARAAIAPREPLGEAVSNTLDRATMRANLVTIHGAVRAFWRYFSAVGDHVDERLVEVLPTVDGSSRRQMVVAMGRFGESMHDGHVFVADATGSSAAGYAGVDFDHLADGTPIVRSASVTEVHVGDALIAVDGRPISEVYDELLAWNGAGTLAYAREFAARALVEMHGSQVWKLRDPDGVERDVTVLPGTAEAQYVLPWGPQRPSGTLADMGAPDVAYLNMDSSVTTSFDQATAVLATVPDAAGLVVDMRGYPGIDGYELATRLIRGAFGSPRFRHRSSEPDSLSDTTSRVVGGEDEEGR